MAARVTGSRCVIEVVNTGASPGMARPAPRDAPAGAENGRGLKIMNAVVDDLRLTSSAREGTTVHFEKTLHWEPGAAGEHLSRAGG